MSFVPRWLPFSRERRTLELQEELRTHIELAAADRVARGESPADAAANARREFGNVGLVQEVSRDKWGAGPLWVERCVQDARFAWRGLRRAPGYAAVSILTVALGIGATTAIYSVADATLLRPLPYPHADRLVRIEDDFVGTGARDVGMSTPEWHDLQRSGLFEHVSPTWYDDNNLTGVAQAQRVPLLIVATNYFAMLGVAPRLGSAFDPRDNTPGFNGQAIISDGLWKRAFGSDPHVLGRAVQLDSDSYRIVGVMPPGFQAPERTHAERGTDVWVAFGFSGNPITSAYVERRPLFPGAIARIKSGLTLDEAQHRVELLVHSLRAEHPADYPARLGWSIRLVPLRDSVVGDAGQSLRFLLAAVGLVLLIGCTNVASLTLARATLRGRELAVRQALGGAPSRLTRQLITEGIMLALLGGVVGVGVVIAARTALTRVIPANVPRINDIGVDWSVLGFAFALSLLAGALFGVAPAWQLRRLDVTRVLKQEGRATAGSREHTRARRLFVIFEFALSLVLLIASTLLLRSFWELTRVPLGFEPRGVALVRTRLPYPNVPSEDLYATVADEEPFVRALVRGTAALPGVQTVAVVSGGAVPLDHPQQDQDVFRVLFEGRDTPGTAPAYVAGAEVTPGYFGLLRIPLTRGRLFNDFDVSGVTPVAVINQAMARAYWPSASPIGARIRLAPTAKIWFTVVGVVADARTESLAATGVPEIYTSIYQREARHLAILARGDITPAALERSVHAQERALNPALPVFDAETLSDAVSMSLAMRRFEMELLALFAATALALAGLGIYGVIAYLVNERSHEIGLRLALGAQHGDVLVLVLRQGLALAGAGVLLGLAAAPLAAHVMSGLLYGVSPTDPLIFAGVTLALTLVAAAACYVPARRAMAVDPMVALQR